MIYSVDFYERGLRAMFEDTNKPSALNNQPSNSNNAGNNNQPFAIMAASDLGSVLP